MAVCSHIACLQQIIVMPKLAKLLTCKIMALPWVWACFSGPSSYPPTKGLFQRLEVQHLSLSPPASSLLFPSQLEFRCFHTSWQGSTHLFWKQLVPPRVFKRHRQPVGSLHLLLNPSCQPVGSPHWLLNHLLARDKWKTRAKFLDEKLLDITTVTFARLISLMMSEDSRLLSGHLKNEAACSLCFLVVLLPRGGSCSADYLPCPDCVHHCLNSLCI